VGGSPAASQAEPASSGALACALLAVLPLGPAGCSWPLWVSSAVPPSRCASAGYLAALLAVSRATLLPELRMTLSSSGGMPPLSMACSLSLRLGCRALSALCRATMGDTAPLAPLPLPLLTALQPLPLLTALEEPLGALLTALLLQVEEEEEAKPRWGSCSLLGGC
jgi:hypothetical protein